MLGVKINDGGPQRSRITSVTVTFDRPVALDAGAITLTRRGGAAVTTTANASSGTQIVLTFTGSGTTSGSLNDGIYDLRVLASKTHTGDLAGTTMAADFARAFHRLFADGDGDGDVDNADRFDLRSTTNNRLGHAAFKWYFDYDADGDVDNADLFEVRGRARITYKSY